MQLLLSDLHQHNDSLKQCNALASSLQVMPFLDYLCHSFLALCSDFNQYFVYGDKHYFKNRGKYIKDLDILDKKPGALEYTPEYYYDQVDPLAELKLDCNGDK